MPEAFERVSIDDLLDGVSVIDVTACAGEIHRRSWPGRPESEYGVMTLTSPCALDSASQRRILNIARTDCGPTPW